MAPPLSAPPTFYAAIEPFLDFAAVADPARYHAAPDDWIVVLADIKGSTEAARAGRYKDVNLIGAACITATLNVTRGLDLPYLGEILGTGAEAAAPVQRANMRFIWPPEVLAAEAVLSRGHGARWRRRAYLLLESFLQLLAERFDLKLGAYDAPAYREELRRNSDHRKLADSLHLLLDCSAAEAAAIDAYLAGLHAAGKIVYGTHRAGRALMTCLVFSLEQSRHVHFIDGADGGYALAALQLKAQLEALAAARDPEPRAC